MAALSNVAKRRNKAHSASKVLSLHPSRMPAEASTRAVLAGFIAKTASLVDAINPRTSHVNATLALAFLKLDEGNPEASGLLATVVGEHDIREGWLGLAVARYFDGETMLAGTALAHALSHHAMSQVPEFANSITRSMPAPGWCSLDSTGTLTVQLVSPLRRRRRPIAMLDGEPITLHANDDGQGFTARLTTEWRRRREIRVVLDKIDLVGSPIDLKRMTRVEGFVDSDNGDLHGWAWCPNDPDYAPEISIGLAAEGPCMMVVADAPTDIVTASALARPRAFHVPAAKLRHLNETVHVWGEMA